MCIRDLRIYSDDINADVFQYRDNVGTECDAVIHYRDGEYGLCEIKLGGERAIEEGCNNLKKLKNKINEDKMGSPSFLMILTGLGEYAYTRQDGIHVIPIGCLKN